jgi:PAS domain S-box-containing protein
MASPFSLLDESGAPKAGPPGDGTGAPKPMAESEEASAGSGFPRLPGTALPRAAGLLLVLCTTLAIELLLLAGIRVPAPAAVLIIVVAYATYLDGVPLGIASAAVALCYEIYSFIWRGDILPDQSSPAFRGIALALLTFMTVALIGHFRRRLDALLRTERKLLAEAESKSQEVSRALARVERAQEAVRFQARLLDAVGQAVIATDVTGRILYWNGPATRLFGVAAKDAARRCITDIMPDPPATREDTMSRLRRGISWVGEMEVARPDGTGVAAVISDSPIRDDAGQTIGLVRVATDVTERKHVERTQRLLADAGSALAASMDYERTLRSVARLCVPTFADCCLVDIVGEDGAARQLQVAHVNPALEPKVRDLEDAYPLGRDSDHPVAEVIRTGMVRFLPSIGGVARGRDAQHASWLERFGFRSAIIAPLRAGGRTLGAISFYRGGGKAYEERDLLLAEELANRAANVIQQARLFEAAMIANRAKSDFLAVMSHELRTPLTTVTGYTDLMLAGVPDPLPERHRGYVHRIRLAATHLLGLIEQILVYARLELGRERTQPVRVRVGDMIREAAVLIEPVATERGIHFSIVAPETDSIIESDATKLRQILVNLLANAVKFTDEGEVSLSATQRDGVIVFTVRDTGIGIAPEHLAHIFDPFWQVDQSSTRRAGGAGLGLSVARSLARALGGDVQVDSEAGSGTRFNLELPVWWSVGDEAQNDARQRDMFGPRSA